MFHDRSSAPDSESTRFKQKLEGIYIPFYLLFTTNFIYNLIIIIIFYPQYVVRPLFMPPFFYYNLFYNRRFYTAS
jgi:hypothetical protein